MQKIEPAHKWVRTRDFAWAVLGGWYAVISKDESDCYMPRLLRYGFDRQFETLQGSRIPAGDISWIYDSPIVLPDRREWNE